jgi:hypothetical protein
MSPTKGWFESDEDYRNRVAREADERTIEDSTGSAPSRGWFESGEDYRNRVAREADEPTFKGYWRRIIIFRFEIVLKAAQTSSCGQKRLS